MSERNVTRAQAGALNLIENVAHGRNVSQVDRDFLWMAHCDLLAELARLNAELADRAIGESIDEADALVLALASALDAAHRPLHPEALDSCDVCALLERARRWAQ